MEILLSCTWLVLVAGLMLRAMRQHSLFEAIPVSARPAGDAPRVAFVIPVRDEEHNIEPCLKSLFAQDYPADRFNVFVVDDHSSDRTLSIVTGLARYQPRLQVLPSPPLPPQWIGKSHACLIGARAASAETEWLCFLDADVRAAPALLPSAIAAAEADHLDLLSLSPRHRLTSFAERLVIPCGLYAIAFYQDMQQLQSYRNDQVTATGQFMLIRNSIYQAVGGHGAVHSAISEDVALARSIKRAGGRVVLRNGRQLVAARMYADWEALWAGLAKNLIDMFGGPVSTIITALAAIFLAWAACLIPLTNGLSCGRGAATACLALVPASAGSAAILAFHMAGASYFGVPLWYGFLFPLGYTIGALMSIDSVRRRLSGRMNWKGRTYP